LLTRKPRSPGWPGQWSAEAGSTGKARPLVWCTLAAVVCSPTVRRSSAGTSPGCSGPNQPTRLSAPGTANSTRPVPGSALAASAGSAYSVIDGTLRWNVRMFESTNSYLSDRTKPDDLDGLHLLVDSRAALVMSADNTLT
jgi:hypothetical protein